MLGDIKPDKEIGKYMAVGKLFAVSPVKPSSPLGPESPDKTIGPVTTGRTTCPTRLGVLGKVPLAFPCTPLAISEWSRAMVPL